MLHSVSIRNFQSLRRVDLELGQLTVVVGPSNSGKSAFLRSMKALASNVRGSACITHGEKVAAVTARGADWSVTLERSDSGGSYRVVSADSPERSYTKLAGAVPAEVTGQLRLEPVGTQGSINFAGQFDKPYLLDSSGNAVATALGTLTNVSLLFDAAKEANRRRLAAAGVLKTRREDLARVQEAVANFSTLREELDAVARAETAIAAARLKQEKLAALRSLIDKVRAPLPSAEFEELPDVDRLRSRMLELSRVRLLISSASKAASVMSQASKALTLLSGQEKLTHGKLTEALVKAGVCPTCSQEIPPVGFTLSEARTGSHGDHTSAAGDAGSLGPV